MAGGTEAASGLDRTIRWGTLLVLGGAVCFVAWVLFETLSRPRTLTGPGLVEERRDLGGSFSLRDQNGRPVSEQDFAGRFVLLYFGYSFCPDVCPMALQTLAQARDRLAEPERVQPLFVTLDPARDTPEHLADYMAAFGPEFIGLTGPAAEIGRLARRFGVVYRLRTDVDPDFYPVDHSSRLYLMNGEWNTVAVLDDDATLDQVTDALRRGLADADAR